MRRMNRAVPLVLAGASGLATVGLIQLHLASQAPAVAGQLEPMVVADRELTDERPLDLADLRVVQVGFRPAGAFAVPAEVVGRLPLVKVPPGQPLLSSHLAEAGAAPGLWHRIDAGKRAVTVAVDEVTGVGGFLKPGLHVDVIGVARGTATWSSRTVAQHVPVLAVAQEDRDARGETAAKVVKSVTLLVSPAQAEAVSLASEEGHIRLVLRAPGDHRIEKLAGQRRVDPVPAKPAAAPAARPAAAAPPVPPPPPPRPAPPPVRGIEVIHGGATEVVRP